MSLNIYDDTQGTLTRCDGTGLQRRQDTATVINQYGAFSVTGTYADVVCVVPINQNYLFTTRGGSTMGKCFDISGDTPVKAANGTEVSVYVFYRS